LRWLCLVPLTLALAATIAPPVALATELADANLDARHSRQPSPSTQVVKLAKSAVGTPYAWGGDSPAGFDCSGLVVWVYAQVGVALPHAEVGALLVGTPVSREALLPGDVLVFQNTYQWGPSHAGIYVGDGRFVHAADEAHGVIESSLDNPYWASRFYGAARLVGSRHPPAADDGSPE
jgi:cell wall-associated NlpC family hydrolase